MLTITGFYCDQSGNGEGSYVNKIVKRLLTEDILIYLIYFQDLAVVGDSSHEASMLPSSDSSQDQVIPFPTHNLLYDHGTLSSWQP